MRPDPTDGPDRVHGPDRIDGPGVLDGPGMLDGSGPVGKAGRGSGHSRGTALGRVTLAAVTVAALSLGAGCGGEEEPPDPCVTPAGSAAPTGVGRTAVLLDVSASTRGAGSAPDWAAEVDAQVAAAVDRGDVVSIGAFDGSASTVAWAIRDRATAPTSTRPNNQRLEREATKSCLRRSVTQAARMPARTDGTDVLGALGVASGQTAPAGEARRTVVIATDGLGTVGCTDLSRAPAGGAAMIEAAVRDCPARAGWPTELAGNHLVMLGVGHPAEGQPIPETGQLAWLRQYWRRLCAAAQAASCEVSTAPVPVRSGGTGGGAGQPPTDPPVSFRPEGGPPLPEPDGTVWPVPSATLFATDSDEVGPAGIARLGQIRKEIGEDRVTRVEVVGYTDSRGSDRHNQDLSERRAAAVGAVLHGLGLPTPVTRGAGETGRICLTEQRPGGAWDEECLQRNRRVEIVISTESG
ncbi:OmpA family protein [Micromonospora antibiotica]|uniref:OmpA family protein n=1 Tax=Micromonospora antibiotica TaxID=2807623 RepID=A0ABS3VEL3_9ACTN|nr:OmpA family protein [Micromonospora antibiotica]MBO4164075.1 OmpA family protein [Micromonospora antibiotica]